MRMGFLGGFNCSIEISDTVVSGRADVTGSKVFLEAIVDVDGVPFARLGSSSITCNEA